MQSYSAEKVVLANLLLVGGDPFSNIKLVEDPDKNFCVVIMKDRKTYKSVQVGETPIGKSAGKQKARREAWVKSLK